MTAVGVFLFSRLQKAEQHQVQLTRRCFYRAVLERMEQKCLEHLCTSHLDLPFSSLLCLRLHFCSDLRNNPDAMR